MQSANLRQEGVAVSWAEAAKSVKAYPAKCFYIFVLGLFIPINM